MQIKTPNSPKTKYSIKVLKSQSINSNYLSQLEACFALSATNKLCLTVWWLFQSGYKGERYFGAAHLEGVLVNVFYFRTLLFLSKLLQTWTSGKAWLIWSRSWFVIQILLVGRTSADLFPVLPLATPVQPLVSTEQSRRSVWDQSCQVPWRSGRWGITVFWEGDKGKEDTRRQLLEEELKTRPGKFHGTVNFFSDTSPALESGLNYEILTNWSSWLATLKLSNWRTSLN